MEFLDPIAKKKRGRRLLLGYGLVTVLILVASTVITYWSYGFDVDRKTGQVIQNGLVYIDSAPDNAQIELRSATNEVIRETSNTKMAVPEGKYDLTIKKTGYRDWKRSFELKGGSIQRITYPLLMLQTFEERKLSDIGEVKPAVITQSPDRRWLLYNGPNLKSYIEYDLNELGADKLSPTSKTITFSDSLFKMSDGPESLEIIEWSTDNKNILVKHGFGTGFEFLILNRDDPTASVNINQHLGLAPTKVSLRDKKADSWYLYTAESGTLQLANLNKTVSTLAASIVDFKPHGEDLLVYSKKVNDTTQNVYIEQNGKPYLLTALPIGRVTLDVARFNRSWFVAVASDVDKKTFIYKNPIALLSVTPEARIAPVAILHSETQLIEKLGFSSNARFIMAKSGQRVGVYDAEQNESYKISITQAIDPAVPSAWMDGHRITFYSEGISRIMDFDGSNNQQLVRNAGIDSLFFDRDYTVMYSVKKADDPSNVYSLYSINIRDEADK